MVFCNVCLNVSEAANGSKDINNPKIYSCGDGGADLPVACIRLKPIQVNILIWM